MPIKIGTPYTGTLTWNAGQQNQDRYVYCAAGGQASYMLSTQSSAISAPTAENMIITDNLGAYAGLALHIQTVKTVHSDSITLDANGRQLWAWGGAATDIMSPFRFDGAGTNVVMMHTSTPSTGYAPVGHDVTLYNGQALTNGMALNDVAHAYIPMTSGPKESAFIIPLGLVGVQMRFKSGAGVLTGNNTYALTVQFVYWS